MVRAKRGGRFLRFGLAFWALVGCTELTRVDWTYIERGDALGGEGGEGGEATPDAEGEAGGQGGQP
jgi:hypothetical protein